MKPIDTTELLQALLAADEKQKAAALLALKGQPDVRPTAGPLLLSVAEAAELLGLHRCTVWRVIRAGRLKKIELFPGCTRLRRADVEALARGEP